jgi:hypothetical protein
MRGSIVSKNLSSSATGTAISVNVGANHGPVVAPLTSRLIVLGCVLAAGFGWSLFAPQTGAQATVTVTAGVQLNRSAAVALHGPWTTKASTRSTGGTFSNLAAPGYAQLAFRGTGIKWTARTNASAGIADVYVDGVKRKSVDLYSALTSYQRVAYLTTGLRSTTHTIRIVRTGRKNGASLGRNITLDAFDVLDSLAPSAPTAPTVTAQSTGARIGWRASPQADVAGYRIYRGNASGTLALIGTTTAPVTTFLDIGLGAATTYTYRILAADSSGNASAMSAPVAVATPAAQKSSQLRFANCPIPTVTVGNRTQLVTALAEAGAGTVIWMEPGSYSGQIIVSTKATASAPMWICGPRTAVIDGAGPAERGGIRIDSSAHVVVAGMTVRNSSKGIIVTNSTAVTVADTRVENMGDEAIHLLDFTTDSTVIGNSISSTGLEDPEFGEGIYIGTADTNWCLYSRCLEDRSDRNAIISNDISRTSSEPIEAKVATTGGIISNNTINGHGMRPSAYALIYVKGNNWVVSHNSGTDSSNDGILVIQRNPGWGMNNIVFDNHFSGSIPGYGVQVDSKDLGNIVGCDATTGSNSIAVISRPCQP